MAYPLYIYIVASCFITLSWSLQCRDEEDNPVDWYVIYKIPKLSNSLANQTLRKGTGYMYISSKLVEAGWVVSNKTIFDNSTAAAHTLAPYYRNNQSEIWLLYNDQPPNKFPSFTKGHTKGVIGGDGGGGFWLIHSVPHYPSIRPKYTYPSSGVRNGQSFICVSFSPQQLNSLGPDVVAYNQPRYYDKRIHEELFSTYPDLIKAINGSYVPQDSFKKTTLKSLENTVFQAFSKNKMFNKDLYEWVADDLTVDLLAETWQNSMKPLPSVCSSEHKIMNIKSISYKDIQFKSSHDHSKWAIGAKEDGHPWVCIGDINRAETQEKRGGGTLCLKNMELWKNFYSILQNIEPCHHNFFLHNNIYKT